MIDVIVNKPSPYGLVFIHDKSLGFIIYHIKHERAYVSYMTPTNICQLSHKTSWHDNQMTLGWVSTEFSLCKILTYNNLEHPAFHIYFYLKLTSLIVNSWGTETVVYCSLCEESKHSSERVDACLLLRFRLVKSHNISILIFSITIYATRLLQMFLRPRTTLQQMFLSF